MAKLAFYDVSVFGMILSLPTADFSKYLKCLRPYQSAPHVEFDYCIKNSVSENDYVVLRISLAIPISYSCLFFAHSQNSPRVFSEALTKKKKKRMSSIQVGVDFDCAMISIKNLSSFSPCADGSPSISSRLFAKK